jgi:hypothetical protein
MNANPIAKYASDPITKSSRFFIIRLFAFFARHMPDSTIAKPACMK